MIVGWVVPLDMIQKGDCQRIDRRGADGLCRLLRRCAGGRPLSDTPGIILVGFGSTEFAQINSFSVDTDEGGTSVIPHLRGRGL